jgi:membrane protein DedA with SNARE-associated domain
MALENNFPPIPSEIIMPMAGFLAARGELHPVLALAVATLGSVAGTLPWYVIGRTWGCKRLHAFARRHGRWVTLQPEDIDKGMDGFRKHGSKIVIGGRLIPAIRTFISIPAGLVDMSLPRFLMYSALGSLVWNTALGAAGYLLEGNWRTVAHYVDPVAKIVLATIVLTYAYRVATFGKRRRS